MKISQDDKEKLLKKQEILTRIKNLKIQNENIPEQLEINKLEELAKDNTKTVVNSEIHDLRVGLQRLKTDLDKVNEDRESNNEKLATAVLSENDRNFINSDLERQAKRQQELNKKIADTENQIIELEESVKNVEKKFEENNKKIDELKKLVAEKSKNNIGEIEKLNGEFDDIKLPDALEELFSIRLSSGVAVAKLTENNVCSACEMVQPPATVAVLKKSADDELLFCEECERILLK